MSHVCRQDAFCTDYGVRSVDELWSNRGSLQRQRRRSPHDLRGAISCHGICSTDVARKSARYRSDAWRQCEQTLCDGLSSQHSSLDAGRRQRVARLAHLVRRCRIADSSGTQALQRHRFGWIGSEEHCLRSGRDHDRSVFESVRLGPVSQSERRRQAAHAAGPARRNPSVYPHQRRKDARSQCSGLHAHRGWSFLRDGSGLLGFHPTLRNASGGWILCYSSKSQHERSANLFQTSRSIDWSYLRSNCGAQRVLRHSTLPRKLETDTIQRLGNWQDFHLSDQQLSVAAIDDCSVVQKSLASRIVLQMDQAALENQEVPGQQRKRRQDANLVRRVDLRTDCHRQKGTSN